MKKNIVLICLSTAISTGLFGAWPNSNNSGPYTKNDGGTDTNTVLNVENEPPGDVTYENSSTLEVDASIINFGSMSFENDGALENNSALFNRGTLTNFGTLNNHSSGTLINFDFLENTGTLNNDGALENNFLLSNSGTLNNSGNLENNFFLENFDDLTNVGILTNNGTLNNFGTLNNDGSLENNSILNNFRNLDNFGNLNNSGTLTNSNNLTNEIGGTLNNNSILNNAGALNNRFGGTLNNSGTLTNSDNLTNEPGGILNNDGDLNNQSGSTLDNFGTLNNIFGGALNNSGTLTNSDNLTNTGTLTNEAGGTLNNSGTLTNNFSSLDNDGTLINNVGGTLLSQGPLNNSGTLTNSGAFNMVAGNILTNNSGGTLNNDGTLFADGDLNNSGVLNNNAGGVLSSFINLFNNGTLNNEGDLNITTGSTFTQAGTLNLNGGTLSLGQNIPLEINDQVTIGTVQVILDEGASLDINNRSSDVSFQMPIINAGTLSDSGGLMLNSDVTTVLVGENTFPGETHVNSGTLYVNGPSLANPGSLITKVFVENATFGGTKFTRVKRDPAITGSGDLDLGVNSIVAPGGDALFGQLTVDRDLHFSETSAMFDLEIDSVSNTDKIVVGGEAHLDGTLAVDHASGFFLTNQRITVLEADGGIFGDFHTTTFPPGPDGNALFTVEYTDTTVDLVALEDTIFVNSQLSSGNSQSVADYILGQVPIDPNSDFGFVVESLGLLSDKALNKALNMMHPGSFALFEGMNLTNNAQVMQILSQHFFRMPQGGSQEAISLLEPSLTASAGDRPFYPNTPVRQGCSRDGSKHHNVWVQPFGSWNSQSQKGQLRGAHYDTAGVLAGYDYLFDNFYVGGALGYTYTNFRWQGSAGKGDIDQVYGGLYSSYFMKYFAVTLSTMVGGNFYETNRRIKYSSPGHPGSSVDRTAHSHSSGIQWTNHLGLIGDLNPLSVPLRAFANLDHFFLHNGSFNESGAKSLNLNVDSKTSNALRSEIGLSSSYTFDLKGGCWTPYAQLSFVNKTLLGSSS